MAKTPLTWIVAGTFVLYSTLSIFRFTNYLASAFDLGIFDQAVRAYSQFRIPEVPIKGDNYNILGDHFHLIIASLAPLYWIWDDARMLLLAQSALISVAVIFVWRFARRRWNMMVSSAICVVFALGWPIQAMATYDFHEVAFAVPLLTWALDAYDRDSDTQLACAAALLLLTREDMGLVVAVIGALRACRRKPRWPGIAMGVGGLVAFVVIVKVIIPAFNNDNDYSYWQYVSLGNSPRAVLHTLLTDPIGALQDIFLPVAKLKMLFWLLAPLAFLPLLSPLSLIALPLLAEQLISTRYAAWGMHYHYNATNWAILVIAAMDGYRRVCEPRLSPVVWKRLTLAMAAIPLMTTLVLPTARGVPHPLTPLVRKALTSTASVTLSDKQAAVASIPAHTCVVAEATIVPHLDATNRVSVLHNTQQPVDFYVLKDSSREAWDNSHITVHQWIGQLTSEGWTVIHTFGTFVVLQSPDYAGPSERCAR